MNEPPRQLTLAQWDERHARLAAAGLREPAYGGRLGRHFEDGDRRLSRLKFDNSPAALRLWNFLLSEEERLFAARDAGKKIVGTMKDLGTVPVMAWSLPEVVAFYPDGAWWIPCVMELDDRLLAVADSLGVNESFCPVRAMLGAFATKTKFPTPDLLISSVGATCDDFSAIAQRVEGLGHPILWWEIPHRREPELDEEAVDLPGNADLLIGSGEKSPLRRVAFPRLRAPRSQVEFVHGELERIRAALEDLAGRKLTDAMLADGIAIANENRRALAELRRVVFTAPLAPLPSLELLIAEMLIIHFCSDRAECLEVLKELLAEARRRVENREGHFSLDAARVFWVNPVADLRVMNLLEACGGRVCGTDYLFSHALDEIPEALPPMESLARSALADPMAGPARDRAGRILAEMALFGAEAIVVSRIPGASHCATEGEVIAREARRRGWPVIEIEVPPVSDALSPQIAGRLEALVETVKARRSR
ncbi:MAG: 2-hydroxyacyl-CoA dehydratase family protein [Candidatus Sumerlaeia bacterium]